MNNSNERGLFAELSAAFQKFAPEKAIHRMHHSYANRELPWNALREKSLTVKFRRQKFAIQLRNERHRATGETRLIMFSQRLLPKTTAAYNTARATFNSRNFADGSYFLSPRLSGLQRLAVAAELKLRRLSTWRHDRISLGIFSPQRLLRRFLDAVMIIEDIKARTADELKAIYRSSYRTQDVRAIGEFSEGQFSRIAQPRRGRSTRLRKLAIDWFKRHSGENRLRCSICSWGAPDILLAEIIQLHHEEPLRTYPLQGKKLAFLEAIKRLHPVCPNCHRIIHCKNGGGSFSIAEARDLIGGSRRHAPKLGPSRSRGK